MINYAFRTLSPRAVEGNCSTSTKTPRGQCPSNCKLFAIKKKERRKRKFKIHFIQHPVARNLGNFCSWGNICYLGCQIAIPNKSRNMEREPGLLGKIEEINDTPKVRRRNEMDNLGTVSRSHLLDLVHAKWNIRHVRLGAFTRRSKISCGKCNRKRPILSISRGEPIASLDNLSLSLSLSLFLW